MEIYITGEIGRIVDYSSMKSRPSFLRKVMLPDEANPLNYIWDGNDIVYDEYFPPKAELSEIEQLQKENELLKKGLEEAKERQDMTDAAMLELADIVLGGGE